MLNPVQQRMAARLRKWEAEHPQRRKPLPKPVTNRVSIPVISRQLFGNGLDERFASMTEAGRCLGVNEHSAAVMIQRAIAKSLAYKNRMWRYVEAKP